MNVCLRPGLPSPAQDRNIVKPEETKIALPPTQIKVTIAQTIHAILTEAPKFTTAKRSQMVRHNLQVLQHQCSQAGKTFIFIEEAITCDRFDLGGCSAAQATLFRGPDPSASVAICVTDAGSLLHRNGSRWQIYENAGDVAPETKSSSLA